MDGIVDFHTHPLYDFHFQDHGVVIDSTRFQNDLKACGIVCACGSVIYSSINGCPVEEYETIVPTLNRQALQCRAEWKGFYYPGIHIHPDFVRMSCEEIDCACEQGIHLIGELVPYMMGWRQYSSKGILEILSYAAERNMVVSMHPTCYEDMDALATQLPHLKIVYAHLSGTDEQLMLMKRHENVCFDYCAHGADHDGMLRYAVNAVGSERILFGTDFPGDSPVSDIQAAMDEQLTDKERENILGNNARRLLNL